MDLFLFLIIKILFLPGLLFILIMSLYLAGLERKLSARMQRRIGPPLLQPWYDFLKCLGKETIIPRKADRKIFLFAPLMGLCVCLSAGLFIPAGPLKALSAGADTIVILYLLTFSSVSLILGSSASGSPFAGVGLSREMVSMISYELPFVIVLLSAGKLAGNSGVTFSLEKIADYQAVNGAMICHISMIPAALAMLFVIPCEAGCHPFDIDEAETEICEGVLCEYSGKPLALFKLMHYVKMYVMSALFTTMFLNFRTGIAVMDFLIYIISTSLVTFVSMSIPHAVSARFRVEQLFYFYWTFVSGLALISLILVFYGI